MKGERITVCVFGKKEDFNWTSGPAPDFEENGYTIVYYDSDASLNEAIKTWNPHIFITFGPWEKYTTLLSAPFEIRQRWLDGTHFSPDALGKFIMSKYMEFALNLNPDNPKVSVFTTAYKTGSRFFRPLKSMLAQTYTNWEWIIEAFKMYPNAGFAYTDCCEVWEETGENFEYPPGWAFGFGSYRDEEYKGKIYRVMNYPEVNAKTIRHIVGCPNHARAWRKNLYDAIGGFNQEIHVADDYDLLVRTFLTTKMIHIKKFGYIQYKSQGSQTYVRNREIQRLVRYLKEYYDIHIHQRCLRLDDPDIVWQEDKKASNLDIGKPSDFRPLSLSYPYP